MNNKRTTQGVQPGRVFVRLLNRLNLTLPRELRLPKLIDTSSMNDLKTRFNELDARLAKLNTAIRMPHRSTSALDIDEKSIALLATNAWKAQTKMIDPDTHEVKEEMKRVYRHIEAIFDTFKGIGIEILDPTGRNYDSGMALKVITFEPTPGISKEEIKETFKPSVMRQGRLIQMGEVIVGTPQKNT